MSRLPLKRRFVIGVLGVYRVAISPIFGPSCRFFPCCSEYAQVAIAQWGVLRGGVLIVKRVLKCHPLHAGGVDEVPTPPDAFLKR